MWIPVILSLLAAYYTVIGAFTVWVIRGATVEFFGYRKAGV